jgi:hypothetical protein
MAIWCQPQALRRKQQGTCRHDPRFPHHRDAPEAQEAKEAGDPIIDNFMLEVLPGSSDAARVLAGDLIMTTMSTVGKELSETPRCTAEIAAYADAMADMFCAYISKLAEMAPS